MLGGEGENRCYLSDLVVFNVHKTSCFKVSDGGGNFKFTSGRNNQIALIGNKLIGLATKNLNPPFLFRWNLAEKSVTLLKKYSR